MESFTVKNLSFSYPNKEELALKNVSFSVEMGEFITICGQSGSGKSTLLKNLKPIMAPHGKRQGEILFFGKPLENLRQDEQAAKIGYVLQNPDNQIVTDKVWHELAFGLESLGMDTKTIRLRVAEMASFFGIQGWFHKDVNHLSGGQRQLLNLAAVMVMQPDILILDEPTSQLDPIAAGDFLETVKKINRELGTTVIITEHRLEDVIAMSDRAIVLDGGEIIADDIPANIGAVLAEKAHPMFIAMPTPLQAYAQLYMDGIGRETTCPINVREGRYWLSELLADTKITMTTLPDKTVEHKGTPVIEMRDVWFRYGKNEPDVVKDLSVKIFSGELFCLVGGNGTGKTTSLLIAGGIRKPYRGKVRCNGKTVVLPQNPQSIFVEKTVMLDLMESFENKNISIDEMENKIGEISRLVEIEHLLDMHPYDLSGGEQQRAALAKVLLMEPEILLLDEPTKGLDNNFKEKLANILKILISKGITVMMVSHDVEFCGRHGDRCAMFFDGRIITVNSPRTFFSGNSFYTTAANRMSRHLFENAVTADDIVELVKANFDGNAPIEETSDKKEQKPYEELHKKDSNDKTGKEKYSIKKTIVDISMLALGALTILVGFFVLDNKQYFIVSFLLVIYAMVPFFFSFEQRKPKAREIVILAVMIAAAVVGRAAFFMVPNFKPILAIIIISGVSLGKESGFLVGAMSAMVSNFLFGQGPWTPWQMIAMAVIGYLAGLIFHKYSGNINKIVVMLFGGLSVFFIYGGIVDIWTILVMTPKPTIETVLLVYGGALYFNLIHAGATIFFLFVLLKPMLSKLERVKIKYGMNVYES